MHFLCGLAAAAAAAGYTILVSTFNSLNYNRSSYLLG